MKHALRPFCASIFFAIATTIGAEGIDSAADDIALTDLAGPMAELETAFLQKVDNRLVALGISLEDLAKERRSIYAEQDQTLALKMAEVFHAKYRPFYLWALEDIGLDPSAIKEALIPPGSDSGISDYLRIIRSTNRCASPLMQAMCDAMHAGRGGCRADTYPMMYRSHFNVLPPANGHTDRQVIYGHIDGTLRLWANDVEGATGGVIGASVSVLPSTGSLCIQTEGQLSGMSVSTYRHHYFLSGAYSHATLVPKVRFPVAPAGRPAACRQQGYPFGTYYYAQRQEGNRSVVGGSFASQLSPVNSACDYPGAPRADERVDLTSAPSARFPYFVEDMAVVATPVVGTAPYEVDVYYQGELRQSYDGATVHGNLDFRLWNIHVLQIPR